MPANHNQSSLSRRLRLALAAVTTLVCLALAPSALAAVTGVEGSLPANADSTPNVSLGSVSCASAGNCSAVGTFYDSSGNRQGLLFTETSGAWATGVEAPLPANASSAYQRVTLTSVSCGSAGNCTAVGNYIDSSGNNEQGLLLSETAGAWATGVEAPLPANADSSQDVGLGSVSCRSAGNCTAVGSYTDSSDNRQALLLTETSGAWATGVEATLPANAGSSVALSLSSVSCASVGNCTAVGRYYDSSGNDEGLLLTETSGAWATGVEATLPANADSNPFVFLTSVSCGSAGNCTAVGNYIDSSGNNEQGLLLSETAGAWATGVEAPLPASAGSPPEVTLNSVSCASAGNCTAVGDYYDSSNNEQGLLLTETAGAWATGVEATPPANAEGPYMSPSSVSCASAGNCTAVGTYGDTSDFFAGLLLTETAGAWAPGVEAPTPADTSSSPNYGQVTLNSVSCASAGNCSAVGRYLDSSDNDQGLMVGWSLANPSISTSQQPSTATVGSSIADKATLAGGDSPTGTVTFNLYNNANGTGTPLFSDTETLVSGTTTSKGYTVMAPGTDYWVATYNGDSNNNPVSSAEPVTVTVTASALCLLTTQDVEGSAKFQALPPLLRDVVKQLATAGCKPLDEIVGKLTAAQTAKLIAAYDSAVNGLSTAGWLTRTQATTLTTLAATL